MELNIIINQLVDKAKKPKKTILESCKSKNKKAVGWVAPYAPEEIIYAFDCVPVGLWGGKTELLKARTYLPVFACSIMQSVMEFEVKGTYDFLEAVLIPAVCDTLKCFGQKWKGTCPVIPFVYPQNRKAKGANHFLETEFKTMISKLEVILEKSFFIDDLNTSIEIYNKYRWAMRNFVELASQHTSIITPSIRHNIIKASYFMDKKEYYTLIKKLNEKLEVMPKDKNQKNKVIVTGLMLEPEELILEFENIGVTIVADDLAQESRQFRTDVPFMANPLSALAQQWINHTACSLAFDPKKQRIQSIIDLVNHYNAEGVVLALMKFCDPEEYDVPLIIEALREKKIPFLVIEIDQQATSFGQVITKVESFVDMLYTYK